MPAELTSPEDQNAWYALARLVQTAQQDTDQARHVADFLLAWHDAEKNGRWNLVDLWGVETPIAHDMLTLLRLIRDSDSYPNGLGFSEEIANVWRAWRGAGSEGGQCARLRNHPSGPARIP